MGLSHIHAKQKMSEIFLGPSSCSSLSPYPPPTSAGNDPGKRDGVLVPMVCVATRAERSIHGTPRHGR